MLNKAIYTSNNINNNYIPNNLINLNTTKNIKIFISLINGFKNNYDESIEIDEHMDYIQFLKNMPIPGLDNCLKYYQLHFEENGNYTPIRMLSLSIQLKTMYYH